MVKIYSYFPLILLLGFTTQMLINPNWPATLVVVAVLAYQHIENKRIGCEILESANQSKEDDTEINALKSRLTKIELALNFKTNQK